MSNDLQNRFTFTQKENVLFNQMVLKSTLLVKNYISVNWNLVIGIFQF